MSKYIRDDGKVRGCISNVVKMTVVEYIYYSIFHWGYLSNRFRRIFKNFISLIGDVFEIIANIIVIILFPIGIIIHAAVDIRKNKKWIEKHNLKSENK